MSANSDQVSRVLELPQDQENTKIDDGVSPVMPFPTSYVLTRDMEQELVDHAMKRLEQLESELGRNYVSQGNGNWWSTGMAIPDMEGTKGPQYTWMGKRLLYDKTFKNEVEWRPFVLGGIFEHSNLIVPAARRICRQMIARAVNYFFGTEPWFAIYPVGANDRERADQADRYIRWKMDQSGLQHEEEKSIERAFIIGESVIKTSWQRKEQLYKTHANVLVDAEGKDILGADGDYITENDIWIPDQATDPTTGQVVQSDVMVLKRDGVTTQPSAMIWQEKLITRRIIHYVGPKANNVNFLDFLCPIDAESVQDADCVVHLYDKPLMELADSWMRQLPANTTPAQRQEAIRKSTDMLRQLNGGSGQPESGQDSNAVDMTTMAGMIVDRSMPLVKIAEFHLRYDADGDGLLEDVMLIVDRDTRTPIFYDYEANVTPEGLRPFSVVRVNEVPGRWYGMGAMEMMNPSQQILDLWMNRRNRSVSGSGRIDIWSSHNTVEGRANPNLEMNWGGTYTPLPGKTAKDIIESVYLQDGIGEKLNELMEFVMQMMMNESGIANANDGAVTGLDTTKLATGIRNIEKSGQELFSLFLGHLEPGLTDCLDAMVKLVFANLNQMEVYRYLEIGQPGGDQTDDLRVIDPDDIANIELDTRILMTRHRGEQIVDSNIRVIELVKQFDAFSYERQVAVRNTFIDMAKALQANDAEKLFTPIQNPTPPAAGAMPNPTETSQAALGPDRQGDILL